jgi:L-asparaginase/Glu-tRNA(Gln) amidotransferase subunit D
VSGGLQAYAEYLLLIRRTIAWPHLAVDLTVNCGKPVIVVGAMRPATAISADGPANLYASVKTGVFPDSKNRGALIVMNDRIGSAFYTQKTHGVCHLFLT